VICTEKSASFAFFVEASSFGAALPGTFLAHDINHVCELVLSAVFSLLLIWEVEARFFAAIAFMAFFFVRYHIFRTVVFAVFIPREAFQVERSRLSALSSITLAEKSLWRCRLRLLTK